MRIAVIQHNIIWRDPAPNFERLAPRIAGAAQADADLIVLAETFSTGFAAPFGEISEPPDGPGVTFLRDSAQRSGAWVCGSVMVRPEVGGRPANVCVLAGPDGEVHRYRKVHTSFFDGEREEVERGEQTLTVEIGGLRVTPLVCYDLRFADIFWDAATGTDCYLVIANWPAARQLHWQTLLRARAIENQAYVVAANRVGTDGNGSLFAGGSTVIDPLGSELLVAGQVETTLLADLERQTVDSVREQFPFQQHRRTRVPVESLA